MATTSQQPRPKRDTNESNLSPSSAKGTKSRRIRTPHPNDVLSGRGGGINSHRGNKVFREWVLQRKEDYNLAGSKVEKSRVANDVMDLVRNQKPRGRFLKRANSSGPSWWVEVDEERALAKTSQALREGAPKIRAAHKDELHKRVEQARKTRKRKGRSSVSGRDDVASTTRKRRMGTLQGPQTTLLPYPAVAGMSPENAINETAIQPQAIAYPAYAGSFSEAGNSLDLEELENSHRNSTNQKTGEKQVAPSTESFMSRCVFGEIYRNQQNNVLVDDPSAEELPLPLAPYPYSNPSQLEGQTNTNPGTDSGHATMDSFVLPEIASHTEESEEFVNPFDNESDICNRIDFPPPTQQSQLLRNISSDEGQNKTVGDDDNKNNMRTSLGNISTRSLEELSDLVDGTCQVDDTEFGEGVKSILDAIHPGLTSPDKGDLEIPTLLMPWRGGGLLRRSNSLSPRGTRWETSGRQ